MSELTALTVMQAIHWLGIAICVAFIAFSDISNGWKVFLIAFALMCTTSAKYTNDSANTAQPSKQELTSTNEN